MVSLAEHEAQGVIQTWCQPSLLPASSMAGSVLKSTPVAPRETIWYSGLSWQQKPFCGKAFSQGVNILQINSMLMDYSVCYCCSKTRGACESLFTCERQQAAGTCPVLQIKDSRELSSGKQHCFLKVYPKYIKKTTKRNGQELNAC